MSSGCQGPSPERMPGAKPSTVDQCTSSPPARSQRRQALAGDPSMQRLAGAERSGSQLSAHALLLAALPGDLSLSACICCEARSCRPSSLLWLPARQRPGLGRASSRDVQVWHSSQSLFCVVWEQTCPEPRWDADILCLYISSMQGLLKPGTGCPGQRWSPHSWRGLQAVWMGC